jgi:DNA polymerase/3'-5' exonuclease PolX
MDMEASVFTAKGVPDVNLRASKSLLEASKLYEARGDAGRASAYARASKLLTQKGAVDISDILEAEGPEGLMRAFKGQGGIGKSISSHLEDFVDQGSWPERDRLLEEAFKKKVN